MQYEELTGIADPGSYFSPDTKKSLAKILATKLSIKTTHDDTSKYLYGDSARLEIIPETWDKNNNSVVMTNEGIVAVLPNNSSVIHVYNLFKEYSGNEIANVKLNASNAKNESNLSGERRILLTQDGQISMTKIEGTYFDADIDVVINGTNIVSRNSDDTMFYGFFSLEGSAKKYAAYYYKPRLLVKSHSSVTITISYLNAIGIDISGTGKQIKLVSDVWSDNIDDIGKSNSYYSDAKYIKIISDGACQLEVL